MFIPIDDIILKLCTYQPTRQALNCLLLKICYVYLVLNIHNLIILTI